MLFLVTNGWTSLHISESREEFQRGDLAKTPFWIKASEEVNSRDAMCNSTAQACIDKTRRLIKNYGNTTEGFHKLVEEIRQQQGAPPAPRGQDVLLTARQEKQMDDMRLERDAAKQDARKANRRCTDFKRKIAQTAESEPSSDNLRQKILKMSTRGTSANISDAPDCGSGSEDHIDAASNLSEEMNNASLAQDLLKGLSEPVRDKVLCDQIKSLSESDRDKVLDEILVSEKGGKYKNAKTTAEGEAAWEALTGKKDQFCRQAAVAISNPSFVTNNQLLPGQIDSCTRLGSLRSTKGMRWDKTTKEFAMSQNAQNGGGNSSMLTYGTGNTSRRAEDTAERGRDALTATTRVNLIGPCDRTIRREWQKKRDENGTVGLDHAGLDRIADHCKMMEDKLGVRQVPVEIACDNVKFKKVRQVSSLNNPS